MKITAAVVAAAFLVVSAPSFANSEKQAMALYAKGESLYNKGKYQEALTAFRSAYKAEPAAGLLFNIAQCLRKLGNHEAAAAALERYLHDEEDIPNRSEIEELLAEEKAASAPAEATPTPTETAPAPTESEPAPAPVEAPPAPAEAAPATSPTPPAPAVDEGISPVVWVAVGGTALVVVVGGAIAAAVALQPPPVPPTGSLGTVDFR